MKQRRSVEETAIILALIFKRSGFGQARMSDQTIRLVSGRKRLEGSFRQNLKDELGEYGMEIVRLDTGDHALIKVSALEAAETVTAAKTLAPEQLERLLAGEPLELTQLLNELGEDEQEPVLEEIPQGQVPPAASPVP